MFNALWASRQVKQIFRFHMQSVQMKQLQVQLRINAQDSKSVIVEKGVGILVFSRGRIFVLGGI